MTTPTLSDRLARALIDLGTVGYTLASWVSSCGPQRYRLVPAGRSFQAAGPEWAQTTVRGADAALAVARAFLLGRAEQRRWLDAIVQILTRSTWSPDTLDAIRDVLVSAGYTIDEPDTEEALR